MELMDIVNQIKEVGITIVVVGYFIFRDYKFNNQLQQTLQALVDSTNIIRGILDDEWEKK